MKLLPIIFCFAFLTLPLLAQTVSDQNFRAFDGNGAAVDLDKITAALTTADVVFLGEQHDDPTAHALEAEILRRAFERYGKTRAVALSMEMFERDAQPVLDEYLQDLINESNFVQASRAWNNYAADYKPLIEFAKANKLPVIAANAPRRYVNRVSRLGRESLNQLSALAKSQLAPLPYAQASDVYAKKFAALMGAMPSHNSNLLDAQSLWDATMAYSIAEHLKKQPTALVVQINGSFHSENRLGAPEHLLRYRPNTKIVVVTMISDKSFPNFDQPTHQNLGDFVIVTNPNLPRTMK